MRLQLEQHLPPPLGDGTFLYAGGRHRQGVAVYVLAYSGGRWRVQAGVVDGQHRLGCLRAGREPHALAVVLVLGSLQQRKCGQ